MHTWEDSEGEGVRVRQEKELQQRNRVGRTVRSFFLQTVTGTNHSLLRLVQVSVIHTPTIHDKFLWMRNLSARYESTLGISSNRLSLLR